MLFIRGQIDEIRESASTSLGAVIPSTAKNIEILDITCVSISAPLQAVAQLSPLVEHAGLRPHFTYFRSIAIASPRKVQIVTVSICSRFLESREIICQVYCVAVVVSFLMIMTEHSYNLVVSIVISRKCGYRFIYGKTLLQTISET